MHVGIRRTAFRKQLGSIMRINGYGPEDAEKEARHFLTKYFQENVQASETIVDMHDIIHEFLLRAPRVNFLKCIDGREHGSKGIGYPPTTIDFFRTEGCRLNTGIGNMPFWRRMDRRAIDAARCTPGTPALFIAQAHTGHMGGGCAAQARDANGELLPKSTVIENSLRTVTDHAEAVRRQYSPDAVYAIHGITNTDDMSKRFIFPDRTVIDTSEIIESTRKKCALLHSSDVFTANFLNHPIPDSAIGQHTENLKVREIMGGDDAPMYRRLETAIAMEAYLLREISSSAQSGNNTIVNPAVFHAVQSILEDISDLPQSLKGPLLYQTIWNIAYTLYQRNRLENMSPEEREEHLEHAETLVCYGEGFELLPRNKAILAKTGRGDDRAALLVAKTVLEGNRKKRPQNHKPIVHINVETTGRVDSWNAFNEQVSSRLAAMTREVYDVFQTDVSVVTTYSHQEQKRYYPVQTYPATPEKPHDPRLSFPIDLSVGLKNDPTFANELMRREHEYADEMFTDNNH